MQVATPTPAMAAQIPSPSRPALISDGLGSSEPTKSPISASPRRLRRSLRLSGAGLGSPQNALNKENIGASVTQQPSTSSKTLDVALSENDKLGTPRLISPLSSSPALHSSPLRSRSSPARNGSPLRRSRVHDSDDIVSSSDESDDSVLVFFGKPSSAEKKKRMHYEQRVLEKRLRHKDSLDLARRRPISFNPDDTMLIDDQHAYGWSWSKSTPTPSRPGIMLLSSPILSPTRSASPTKSRGGTRTSSPDSLPLPLSNKDMGSDQPEDNPPSSEDLTATQIADTSAPSEVTLDPKQTSPKQGSPQKVAEEVVTHELQPESRSPDSKSSQKPEANPFIAAQTSPTSKESAPRSPSKQRAESPRRAESPVRLIETLIGATMARNRDLTSPMRSPRRSPRLSLRALQLSTSPTKSSGNGLFFGPTTPFQQAIASQQATAFKPPLSMQPAPPLLHSTPFQQSATVQPIPPSTGLSRFACLQNLSPNRVPETPSNKALSMRLAHHTALPSPFISNQQFEPSAETSVAATLQYDSASPSDRAVRGAHVRSSPQKPNEVTVERIVEVLAEPQPASPSKVNAPGTPSVRFVEPEAYATPSGQTRTDQERSRAARTPSPAKAPMTTDVTGASEQDVPQPAPQSTPQREISAIEDMPSTPPPVVSEIKPETPGPVFRQTARRVPIHQHEADFGVKVSPEKPSYSPRKGYANSSARANDFGTKLERIPARRVQVQSAPASRSLPVKQGESSAATAARVPSVASKAARTVSTGATRIGGQSTSLPAAALSRAVSASAAPSITTPASARPSSMSTSRVVPSAKRASVASKASRLQRPAPTALGSKPSSPSRQQRSLSGLPRPKLASAATAAAPATGTGSRLPRPAALGSSTVVAKSASRPVPMAIARLAPVQQSLHRAAPGPAASGTPATTSAVGSQAEASSAPSELSGSMTNVEMREVPQMDPQVGPTILHVEAPAYHPLEIQERKPETAPSNVAPLRKQISSAALRVAVAKVDVEAASEPVAQTQVSKATKSSSRVTEAAPARSSSPVVPAPPSRPPPSSARVAPAVVLDPEQQRLRCLAMQEKARNRTPKASSSTSVPSSSDAEELVSNETGSAGDSPPADGAVPASGAPTTVGPASAVEALANKHAEAIEAVSDMSAPSGGTNVAASTTTSTGRPLRSTRATSRPLAPSATRVPPSRGRALSLNDIIAARKIDVPLSLTDQLRLADTVNKKRNEKTLARYKVTKVQRPYERPPSPERHDHEPEACTIIEDVGSHRQGKGDLAPYSTPVKSSLSGYGSSEARKSVRWYRPLFVGKGSQYGIRASGAKPALKPIRYELDRMGNKVATGSSPKLSKGQSIIIYRNYFKGEPEPADD